MKLLFSLSWFVLIIAPPPPSVFAMVATAKKTTKHAKKNKTSDETNNGFAPVTEPPIDQLGKQRNDCDPSSQELLMITPSPGCENNDCADPLWLDGCEACMCFNHGNPTWCDGYRGDFYDKYFEEHGDNPFGDTNWRNRKCNPIFRQYGDRCLDKWQCAKGLTCQIQSDSPTNLKYCLP